MSELCEVSITLESLPNQLIIKCPENHEHVISPAAKLLTLRCIKDAFTGTVIITHQI
jgi:hypothetical protein